MKVAILKNGRILEYPSIKNKYFWFYLLRRFLALILDWIIVAAMMYGVTIFIKNPMTKYIIASLFGIVFASIYYLVCLSIANGQTIGYKLTMLILVKSDMGKTIFFQNITKSILMSVYCLPFFGVAILLTNIIMLPITKGVSLLDLWSKTSVITVRLHNEIVKEEEELKRRENYE